jgi:hypothetical protein
MASVRANQVAQLMLLREEQERRTPLDRAAKVLTSEIENVLSALEICR